MDKFLLYRTSLYKYVNVASGKSIFKDFTEKLAKDV